MSEFIPWPKIPRFNRNVIITEKIDGTNACVIIEEAETLPLDQNRLADLDHDDTSYAVYAQSRKRLITSDCDNFGFAAWVQSNAAELVELLGPGRHFGEWYGAGIQRRYGLDHRRFALFNVGRWSPEDFAETDLPVEVVPVLETLGQPDSREIQNVLRELRRGGSFAVPGFMNPEGIVLYHTAAKQTFKVLLEGDDVPKGAAA